ncbi:MAG: phosphoribosylformylglycinamidine synthase subunit PurQ [Bacteroidota bacterium]|nr:phosphoribosylformylglycinamidine synthase subunit PurQ [Candidatus Kapabacteria bacterium]MCS7302448.1 phosphoribosylformylglycinamidine synthase subunit PurQ [Candidatus Kapabacteria bacterium]MDW8074382.1 phosphoribosylformylglycinamidine synthase subunit PurQ [Bacteroidota bacterium]MDW8271142.1 phosphoribosylformylglycinamidine synthase subunit PurQ [Bacteroidota bacterium]
MKVGIVVFPGSNCDRDTYYAVQQVCGIDVQFLWHKDGSIPSDVQCVILPGGFSYGDYLRSGAIARFSPIMRDVVRFAQQGGLVLGICNGFQILTEAGLLPGALLRNANERFICRTVHVRVENSSTPFTTSYTRGQVLQLPIAHGEGRYYAPPEVLDQLHQDEQIVFRYTDSNGISTPSSNPNGSVDNIAGICNRKRNVLGLMPHPERAIEALLGSEDGKGIFYSLMHYFEEVGV